MNSLLDELEMAEGTVVKIESPGQRHPNTHFDLTWSL